MNKILIPTDFSEGAFNALIHGLNLAKMMDGSISIVHAYSMPPTGSNVMVDISDILKKNAEEELTTLEERVSGLELAKGVNIEYSSSYGSVVDVVNRKSNDENIDMVIMGTQGASGITEKWLGSNTAAAARNVNIPLLAIPAEKPFMGIENILFSTDMNVIKKEGPLSFVAELAKKADAKVKFVHIRDSEQHDDSEDQAFKDQVQRLCGDLNPDYTFIQNDAVEKGIEEAIEKEKPSMLVMVRHEYGFFESIWHSSVTRSILNSASLPILVLNG